MRAELLLHALFEFPCSRSEARVRGMCVCSAPRAARARSAAGARARARGRSSSVRTWTSRTKPSGRRRSSSSRRCRPSCASAHPATCSPTSATPFSVRYSLYMFPTCSVIVLYTFPYEDMYESIKFYTPGSNLK